MAIIIVLMLSIGFIAGNFFFELALKPGVDKTSVLQAPHNELHTTDDWEMRKQKNKEWFEASGYTSEFLESFDGLKLHAYQIENKEENHKWAIIAHGYTGKAEGMSGSARQFNQMGFNVLLPDARGHGESEGDYIGMGWHDRLDIIAWINTLVAKDPDCEIVLYGVSMGGATVMMVSGENLQDNVKVIVEDCGYASVKEEFSYQMKQLYGLPAFPLMNFSSIVAKMRAGYTLEEASAIKQVANSETPILFIHGTDDTFVPPYMMEELYDAAGGPKEKFLVEGATHGMSATVAGDAYWEKVQEFIERYM